MTKTNISSVLAGDFGADLSDDKVASARAYDTIVSAFTDWPSAPPRQINMLSRFVFSSLHEDDQRRWVTALFDTSNISKFPLIGTGGASARSWDRASFVISQIPADRTYLVPPDALREMKETAAGPQSHQARRAT